MAAPNYQLPPTSNTQTPTETPQYNMPTYTLPVTAPAPQVSPQVAPAPQVSPQIAPAPQVAPVLSAGLGSGQVPKPMTLMTAAKSSGTPDLIVDAADFDPKKVRLLPPKDGTAKGDTNVKFVTADIAYNYGTTENPMVDHLVVKFERCKSEYGVSKFVKDDKPGTQPKYSIGLKIAPGSNNLKMILALHERLTALCIENRREFKAQGGWTATQPPQLNNKLKRYELPNGEIDESTPGTFYPEVYTSTKLVLPTGKDEKGNLSQQEISAISMISYSLDLIPVIKFTKVFKGAKEVIKSNLANALVYDMKKVGNVNYFKDVDVDADLSQQLAQMKAEAAKDNHIDPLPNAPVATGTASNHDVAVPTIPSSTTDNIPSMSAFVNTPPTRELS